MFRVQPPLKFIPPAINPLVVKSTQLILPLWLQQKGITHIQAENVEVLADLYRQFQAGKIRFLMAFRHPNSDDPLCMLRLISHIVPQVARQQNISLQQPIHSHFIYDRGIPLWAGAQFAWLYSRLGGIPIHRGKVDRTSLRIARDLFANAKLPMAAAPEGATNGHNEIVSPLEPGVAQLGFWCVEDLVKAERSELVFIVPIGIQYRYVQPPWESLEKVLTELEKELGKISPGEQLTLLDRFSPYEASLYQRLYVVGGQLLCLMEDFYTRFYHQTLSVPVERKLPSSYKEFSNRLQALLNAGLNVAEQYFGILPKGSIIDRCRRIEQAGWDYIYREDIQDVEALSSVERGLADRIAQEANLRVWHMRLVESFVAVTGRYVLEKPTAERFAEITLLLWDTFAKIKGGKGFSRPSLGKQWVQMTVGQPISVSDRFSTYQSDRRGAKQAVTELTCDLQTALEETIK